MPSTLRYYALALTYRDDRITRNGWVKMAHTDAEQAQASLIRSAQSVPGFVAHDRMIEVTPNSNGQTAQSYFQGRVHFQLSIGDGATESYYRDAE